MVSIIEMLGIVLIIISLLIWVITIVVAYLLARDDEKSCKLFRYRIVEVNEKGINDEGEKYIKEYFTVQRGIKFIPFFWIDIYNEESLEDAIEDRRLLEIEDKKSHPKKKKKVLSDDEIGVRLL